jgi:amino acid transporter
MTIPFFRGDFTAKPVFVSTLILAVCIAAFITWIVLLYQLIVIAEGKKTPKRFLVWTFLIPYANALWVPWALISSNGYIKKAQENYYKVNAYESAIGTHILSIPLLILYLFWGVIGFIMRKTLVHQLQDIEVLLPIGIVAICILIVALFYLINLSIFVSKMRKHLHSKPKYK